ncbi:hypothetical protein GE09DRAFT_263513 [Coniochaeta sp. 2T2.1]|nr:hypothetical protein GE09DRAFT_263513 [Coniochaeta sp. 2T2.1]
MAKELPEKVNQSCFFEYLSWDDEVSQTSTTKDARSPGTRSMLTARSLSPPSRLPQLPLEIWTAIVSYLTGTPDDLCWTWLNLRLVSRGFNSVIETAVRHCVLRSAEILFPVHLIKTVRSVNPPMVTMVKLGTLRARFDRMSEDGGRVFFRDRDARERIDEDVFDLTVKTWVQRNEAYLRDAGLDIVDVLADYSTPRMLQRYQFDQPPHVLIMGGMVNDTELPGLEYDADQLEISFRWKPMLTLFLAEEERVNHLERTAKLSHHERVVNMRQRLHAGRLDIDDALLAGVDMTRMREQIRRKVRCFRFQHDYQRIGSPVSVSPPAFGQSGRVNEHLRLTYMRVIREGRAV